MTHCHWHTAASCCSIIWAKQQHDYCKQFACARSTFPMKLEIHNMKFMHFIGDHNVIITCLSMETFHFETSKRVLWTFLDTRGTDDSLVQPKAPKTLTNIICDKHRGTWQALMTQEVLDKKVAWRKTVFKFTISTGGSEGSNLIWRLLRSIQWDIKTFWFKCIPFGQVVRFRLFQMQNGKPHSLATPL